MKTETVKNAVVIREDGVLIADGRSALELIANLRYQTGCSDIVLYKENLAGAFFVLSTGLAGEVLQKFVNYGARLAVVGDFSGYTSKPLRDFIRESNRGHQIFFAASENEAIERLTGKA